MASEKTRLVLFDWSGTLSDDRQPVYIANNQLLQHYGKPEITFENWISARCGSAVEFARKNGVTEPSEEVQEKFASIFKDVVSAGLSKPVPYDNIRAVLASLKDEGKQMILISSHPEKLLRREAKEYGVDHYFDEIIGSIFEKSVIITEICTKYKVPLLETCYIGDTCQDMAAAKRAGVPGIAVWTGYHSKEQLEDQKPDHLVEHVGGAAKILGVESKKESGAANGLRKMKNGNLFCYTCGKEKTPQWRRGPYFSIKLQNRQALCNACGLKWRKKATEDSVAEIP